MAARELECGCLIGEEGPIILCRRAERLSKRVNDLIPPFEDVPDDWDAFHAALDEYRLHTRQEVVA